MPPISTRSKLDAARRAIVGLHKTTYEVITSVRQDINRQSKEVLVDVAFLLREMAVTADDVRKECTVLQELAEKIACARWVTEHLSDPRNAGPIRGEMATGTPDVKQMASLPKPGRDPENFEKLMTHIGVLPSAMGLVRPHWPSMTEYITELARTGKPLPPGISATDTYPVYRLHPLRRRESADDK